MLDSVVSPPKVDARRFYYWGFLTRSLFVVDKGDALALVLEAAREILPAAVFALID
jgi:hypothetical protein